MELLMGRGSCKTRPAPWQVARSHFLGQIVFSYNLQRLLEDLPKLDGLVICGQEIVGGILPSAPLDFVDFLLYFERLEVIELWLVGLKLGVEFVFACLLL